MSETMVNVNVANGLEQGSVAQSKARAATSRLALFLRASLPDFALCVIVSTALTFTVSFGFESAAALRTNALLEAGVSAAVLVALFIGSWSRKALIVSVAMTIAVSIGILMWFSSMMPADVPLFADGTINDVEENYVVFALVAIVVTVVVFLLSRRTTGLFFLLLTASLACGTVQFLYREWSSSDAGIIAFLVVLAGIVMMFVYQVYRSSILNALRAKKPAFVQVTGFALVIAAACVGMAYLLYVLVIAQLGLTTPVIKPFHESYQRPEIEYTGMFSRQQIEDPNLKTRNLGEEQEDTSDTKSEASTTAAEQLQEALSGASQAMESFNSGEWVEQFQTLGYQVFEVNNLLTMFLVALGIAAVVALQRRRRLWRLKRWRKLDPSDQVEAMYAFFVKRFKRLAVRRQPNLTLLEWAFANRGRLAVFSRNEERVDFLKLTLMYQRVVYAQSPADLDQVRSFESFYDAFFANARKYVGKARWLWKFWRI